MQAEEQETVSKYWYQEFLKLLAPFAPHIAEELWHILGEADSIHSVVWPTYEEEAL
jgi:leucyl-tRNA synthetase